MVDWGEVALAALVGIVLFGGLVVVLRSRAEPPPPPLPNPLADSPAVTGSLAALGPQLAPGGAAAWLTFELGGERPAVEALVGSLQPGLPDDGPFAVNRLVARAPVRITGRVADGVPVVTDVLRLDAPAEG